MEQETTQLQTLRTCSRCKQTYPETEEFFYSSGRRTVNGRLILKSECKRCTKELRDLNRASQREQGFVWEKITQARFKNIAKTIEQHTLTPEQVLALNKAKATKLSYNMGARLKAVKYAITTKHPEAMHVLFGWHIDTPFTRAEEADFIESINAGEPEQEPMTIGIAAQNLLDCEKRLASAKLDLLEAQKMLRDAETELNSIRTQRNEAILFLTNFARELEDD